MSLRVENLSLQRGTRILQENLSFALDAGQALWVRGPNGVGKSTLLETICGFRAVLTGEIFWTGQATRADLDVYHEALGFIGHKNGNNPNLTCEEALRFYAALYQSADVGAVLESVALGAQRDVLVKELSAGQQKRLALARLFLRKAKLWILDEAPVSLDADGVALLVARVKAHLADGGLVLMTSHVDLGLEAVELHLEPLQKATLEARDAFLAGDWQGMR